MKRWLFNLAASASLLAMVAVAAVWVRSYWVWDQIGPHAAAVEPQRSWTSTHLLTAVRGHLFFAYLDDVQAFRSDPAALTNGPEIKWHWVRRPAVWNPPTRRWFNTLGFDYNRMDATQSATETWTQVTVIMPCWFPMLLSAIAPALWLCRNYKQRTLRRTGCCPACGYDLRATPDRCPECGHVPAEVAG